MSNLKVIQGSSTKSEQYSKSSSKRLFESVFKILDHDDLEISSFDQIDTNGSRIANILSNQQFREMLTHKIRSDNLCETYPILKVSCIDNINKHHMLDSHDLQEVFSSFGDVYKVYITPDESVCYIFYKSFCSAYVAMKLLNGFSIRYLLAKLHVTWCYSNQYENLMHIFPQYHNRVQWDLGDTIQGNQNISPNVQTIQTLKQNKLTCRYDIQIQNEREFQVARRIIGTKGINMKKIIQSALEKYYQNTQTIKNINNNQILKLRLRGKGSGYKQGPEQLESEEDLHLCISAKDLIAYTSACQGVQKLIQNVYYEYTEYTRKLGKELCLELKKVDMNYQVPNSTNSTEGKTVSINNGRMEPPKIEQLLQMRNKARRQLNFAQADRIRNYLRACGVCLIDEKGRRGRATEVTTWKYLL